MNVGFSGSSERLLVQIGGSVQIDNAEELAARLEELLSMKAPLVCLDLSAVSDLDASFLQLVVALNLSLISQGRSLELQSLSARHPVHQEAETIGLDLERLLGMGGSDGRIRG